MDQRDWIMMGLGFGIGFFVLTSIGRDAIKTGVGVSKAEAERLLKKVQKRSKKRAQI